MNKNSVICNFINDHKDNWEELLTAKNIVVKISDNIFNKGIRAAIFNYNDFADFSDPVVQEARGIIIDLDSLSVLCWPFRKFGNYNESYADKIDWSTARVQDKIDGSIIKLWYCKDEWVFSTNGSIDAKEASLASFITDNYDELIRKADNYAKIPFGEMNPNRTYIFELVSPENTIVIRYKTTHLWHIGTRDNLSVEELCEDIGIDEPREYDIRSLDGCILAARGLNEDCGDSVHIKKEGFVVVDEYWNRVKIKSPEYLYVHRLIGNWNLSKNRILEMIRTVDKYEIDRWLIEYPMYRIYIAYYEYKLIELDVEINNFIRYAINLYHELSRDRKVLAEMISKHRLASYAFKVIDYIETDPEYVFEDGEWTKNMPLSRLKKMIPDYTAPKIEL